MESLPAGRSNAGRQAKFVHNEPGRFVRRVRADTARGAGAAGGLVLVSLPVFFFYFYFFFFFLPLSPFQFFPALGAELRLW
ncbi:hypothetical protein CDL15_Pgr015336 [Punica granatum]|uniref:Uncharacterized protein n=1 Tax=Punica granatum TaxID=22663 RepID=A0A218W0W0_PUNGR|nr:hypothetical protein CDL15_Pgr015336 [Punica granatum]